MIYLHCRLYPWGAYNVLQDLILEDLSQGQVQISEISILTTISDHTYMEILRQWETHHIPVITTLPLYICKILNTVQSRQIPLLKSIFDHRNLIVFAPRLIAYMSKQLRKMKPTHVTVSSFALCKNIDIPQSVTHSKLYLHSPMQYIHSHATEYDTKITWRKGRLRQQVKARLLRRDSAPRPAYDTMYANSMYTARLAYDIYGRACLVKYPQIHIWKVLSKNDLYNKLKASNPKAQDTQLITLDPPYYIYIGRVVKFVKEIDRIVKLFNETGDQLLIIGDGPDMAEMKALSHENIHYLGWIQDLDVKTSLLAHSQGIINITKESFGLVTAEAVHLWVPVFGYKQWWSVELVRSGKWVLVESKEHEVLVKEWERFKTISQY